MLIKLGDLIEKYNEGCNIPDLTVNDVHGININKEFFSPTIQIARNTSKYLIVSEMSFACNLMHVGRDGTIPISYNNLGKDLIVSPAYFVFKNIRKDIIIDEYLFLNFSRQEFDRYATFCTDSSVRDGLSWDRFCEIEIEVPSIEIQKKYVEIFHNLTKNQKNIESSLEDLRLASQIGIEKFRDLYPTKEIRNYITEHKTINSDLKVKNVKSLNREMGFLKTTRRINNMDKYKVVNYDDIVYPPPHFGEVGTIGIYKEKYQSLVSPMYVTFSVDKNYLLPDYLFMWFKRKSFMRFAFFLASSSIRDTFDFEMLSEYKIPFPPLEKQQMIVDLFNVYEKRKKMNEELKNTIRDIIPILIKGAIQESKGVI